MFRKIGLISRAYPHMNRYREIISVLIKYGFGEIVTKSHLDKYIHRYKRKFSKQKDIDLVSLSRWERIRLILEELGPTFIKLGQIMSNRPDLLPQKLLDELEKLQDTVRSFSEEDAQKLIEKELGQPIATLFKKFTNTPLASASIAQVHRAVLTTGEKVVIKVQRPTIEQTIAVDLEIMLYIAGLIKKHIPETSIFNLEGIVKEFERTIKKEIDFTIEAVYLERFSSNLQNDSTVYVPKIHKKYSTKKIITMEFIDGIKISDTSSLLKSGANPKLIAARGAQLILKQTLEDGFFHADPHPGNLLVMNNNVICFLDFGMMGVLLPKHRKYIGDMIIGILDKDAAKIIKVLMQLSPHQQVENIEELEYLLFELIDQYAHLPLKNINMGKLLANILKIIINHNLEMPPNIYLLLKSLVTIEGVARKLDPDFNMLEHAQPFAQKLLWQRFGPQRLAKDIHSLATDYNNLLHNLPADTKAIIEKIKLGEINVILDQAELKQLLNNLDQVSNRISFAIVLASLIIGSSLIVLSQIPPHWNEIPIIGIVGFLSAGLMGFWLLISILKHGRM
ncbi:MAG: AarF/ABC1/UbiB kinase family protein [Desulfotomaculum sp.]|nr:AarF/ABC1/UbiB kinase family protein [Desulfotomaculum sp.]